MVEIDYSSFPFNNLYREACEGALEEKHLRDSVEVEGFLDETTEAYSEQLEALGRVFRKAAEGDTPAEVRIYTKTLTFWILTTLIKQVILLLLTLRISGARLSML